MEPSQPRPPYEHLYIYGLLLLAAYFVADVTTMYFRENMLPTQTPAPKTQLAEPSPQKQKKDYATITARNIFNSDGEIPKALGDDGSDNGGEIDDGPAVPSQLPLTLVGTIVHVDPARSVATVQSRSNNKIKSYRLDYDIEGIARVMKVERKRLIFRNLSNNRKEYIEIKNDIKINLGLKKVESAEKDIKIDGDRITLDRSIVEQATSNLPELLQQARAVPNIIPNSGGQVEGFRILEMEKGSIFEKLGLQVQDVIKGVNGEPVDSPAKAMELYNALKSSQRIDLDIERGGRTRTMNYIVE